jgi:cobalt/nickel transport protein
MADAGRLAARNGNTVMNGRLWIFAALALFVALCMAVLVSPYASSSPDGLERVAEDKGFLEKGEGAPLWRHALMPDYVVDKLGGGPAATAAAGLVGTLCAFAVGYILARLIRARRQAVHADPGPREGSRP